MHSLAWRDVTWTYLATWSSHDHGSRSFQHGSTVSCQMGNIGIVAAISYGQQGHAYGPYNQAAYCFLQLHWHFTNVLSFAFHERRCCYTSSSWLAWVDTPGSLGLGRIHEHTSDALLSSFCILALLYALELLDWDHSVLLFHSQILMGRRHFGRNVAWVINS